MKKILENKTENKKQLLLLIIGLIVLIGGAIGITYAFFSYVYNSEEENSIRTGTVFFTASDTYMELSNVFPTTLEKTDKVATVSVQGSTTYEDGIDFMIKATEVKSQNPNIIPTVVVTRENVTGITYTDGKDTTTTYDKNNRLTADTILCAGNIAQGDGVDDLTKILTIKVYYDMNDYHISDNNKDELVASGLLDKNYSGEIIDTATWNALSNSNLRNKMIAYSFRIQVIAVDGGEAVPVITIDDSSVNVTGNSITVPYTVDQSDATVTCEYGKSESYGNIGTVSNNQCVIDNLDYGTEYFYKLTATNVAGKSSTAKGSKTTITYCNSILPEVTTTCNSADYSSKCPHTNYVEECGGTIDHSYCNSSCGCSDSGCPDPSSAQCKGNCVSKELSYCINKKISECSAPLIKSCITTTMKSNGCTGY